MCFDRSNSITGGTGMNFIFPSLKAARKSKTNRHGYSWQVFAFTYGIIFLIYSSLLLPCVLAHNTQHHSPYGVVGAPLKKARYLSRFFFNSFYRDPHSPQEASPLFSVASSQIQKPAKKKHTKWHPTLQAPNDFEDFLKHPSQQPSRVTKSPPSPIPSDYGFSRAANEPASRSRKSEPGSIESEHPTNMSVLDSVASASSNGEYAGVDTLEKVNFTAYREVTDRRVLRRYRHRSVCSMPQTHWVRDDTNCTTFFVCARSKIAAVMTCPDSHVWSNRVTNCVPVWSRWDDCISHKPDHNRGDTLGPARDNRYGSRSSPHDEIRRNTRDYFTDSQTSKNDIQTLPTSHLKLGSPKRRGNYYQTGSRRLKSHPRRRYGGYVIDSIKATQTRRRGLETSSKSESEGDVTIERTLVRGRVKQRKRAMYEHTPRPQRHRNESKGSRRRTKNGSGRLYKGRMRAKLRSLSKKENDASSNHVVRHNSPINQGEQTEKGAQIEIIHTTEKVTQEPPDYIIKQTPTSQEPSTAVEPDVTRWWVDFVHLSTTPSTPQPTPQATTPAVASTVLYPTTFDAEYGTRRVYHSSTTTRKPFVPECGVSMTSMIVGGLPAQPGRWPWVVSLQLSWVQKHVCGATLVHPQWVVTAAHCVAGPHFSKANEWRAIFWQHRSSKNIERIVKHPDFVNGDNYPNDIALLKLTQPVDVTTFDIRQACLPKRSKNDDKGWESCWIMGWGENEGDAKPELKELEVNIRKNSECSARWGWKKILNSHVCVGNGDRGACNGDSGGPLICRRGGYHFLAGVTSWGVRGCKTTGYPSVFTRVAYYHEWIHHVIDTYSDIAGNMR